MSKNWEEAVVVHADGCTTNLGIIGATCNCGATAQAEKTWDIAYKAGQRSVQWDGSELDRLAYKESLKRQGEREVVEWVEKYKELAENADYSNGVEFAGMDEGRVRSYELLKKYEKEWQAYLKKEGIENREGVGMTIKQQSRYVRLSPVALYRVPDCYGSAGKPDPLSDACLHCFLRKPCQERQEVLWR